MTACCATPGCSTEHFSLEKLLRHAERFGPDCVYETALEHGADASVLGKLAAGIRKLDRRWKLTRDQQTGLAHRLLNVGADGGLIRNYTGLSSKSLESLIHPPESESEAPLAAASRNTARRRPNPRCGECGVEIAGKRADARFCSEACKQAAYRSVS